jgi:hypothetical protein
VDSQRRGDVLPTRHHERRRPSRIEPVIQHQQRRIRGLARDHRSPSIRFVTHLERKAIVGCRGFSKRRAKRLRTFASVQFDHGRMREIAERSVGRENIESTPIRGIDGP